MVITGESQNSISNTMFQNEKDIIWDVLFNCSNSDGQNDYVVFGEAPDANDGPPIDDYDMLKPPAPFPPYIRTWFDDNLPSPYDILTMDYRYYPDSYKVWNLSVQWKPSTGSSPTTITMVWDVSEIDESEYSNVTLCTVDGTPLQNMILNSTYIFSCPAYETQLFIILCQVTNEPPIANDDSANVIEDSTNNQIDVLSNDDDPDEDLLTIISVTQPSHGTSTTNGAYCFYTPTPHYHGSDSFTYTISDEYGAVDTAAVLLNVIAKQYYLTITVQGSGTVTKVPDQQSYTYGQVINLTAHPSTGWVFNHWDGDLSGNMNPTTITMNGNKSVIANFTQSNSAPLKPGKPTGTSQGKAGESYDYSAVTTDGEGDQLYYQFDWDDGNTSQWIGPYDSGVVASTSHTWSKKGNYNIKVKAKDTHGAESLWSDPLSITMPVTQRSFLPKIYLFFNLLIRFIQEHFARFIDVSLLMLTR